MATDSGTARPESVAARVEVLEHRSHLLQSAVTLQHQENGLLLERVQVLEKQMAAHTALQEAVLFIWSTESASDEAKREVFRGIMAGAKMTGLLADAEAAAREGARDGQDRKLRELLRKASLPPAS
jgi:hypothetical protein